MLISDADYSGAVDKSVDRESLSMDLSMAPSLST